ncbi:glycosyltransferase [Deinococcus sp. HMF7604]|uniref:glycosyltransferase n=1 Tax=Deinococcus betulae TaxID=2873312 RepID=UPI001CC91531|nr:glycosyltransferase [Deinococcus betulae]
MNGDKVLFFGSLVPDDDRYISRAFSRAGNTAQVGFLTALGQAGYPAVEVLSFQPRSVTEVRAGLVVPGGHLSYAGTKLRLLSYVNLPVFKTLTLICAFLFHGFVAAFKHRPTFIMTYNFSLFLSISARIVSRMLKIPYVPIIYDMDIPGQTVSKNLYRQLDFVYAKTRLDASDGVIVISERIANDFLKRAPYLLIEGGVAEIGNPFRRTLSGGPFLIFFAGALEEYNGVDVMLEAVDLLKDMDYKFVIAGSGQLKDLVVRHAQENPNIEFLGFVSGDMIRTYLQQAHVLINHRSYNRISSPYVFPSKLIEYMASGLPTISTRFEGLPPDYERYLVLLDDETPEALARALRYVAEHDDEAQALGLGAQQFVSKQKTWRAHGRMLGAFLDRVVQKNRSGERAP